MQKDKKKSFNCTMFLLGNKHMIQKCEFLTWHPKHTVV